MEKYFAFMKRESDGKETVTSSWNNKAIDEWIAYNEKLGYKLVKRG